jgi:hypothetical protein
VGWPETLHRTTRIFKGIFFFHNRLTILPIVLPTRKIFTKIVYVIQAFLFSFQTIGNLALRILSVPVDYVSNTSWMALIFIPHKRCRPAATCSDSSHCRTIQSLMVRRIPMQCSPLLSWKIAVFWVCSLVEVNNDSEVLAASIIRAMSDSSPWW